MTEAEWLTSEDPGAMLKDWPWAVSERKARLFACACCRRIWSLLPAPESRRAVEVSEKLADGRARDGSRAKAHDAATQVARRVRAYAEASAEAVSGRLLRSYRKTAAVMEWASRTAYYAHEAAYTGAYHAAGTADRAAFDSGNRTKDAERAAQAALVRDIFSNPYRPVVLDSSWLTTDVLLLARSIYEEKAFDRMPILADALQDAGCTNDAVPNHCRDAKQVHVRGCWVVDLLLGKG